MSAQVMDDMLQVRQRARAQAQFLEAQKTPGLAELAWRRFRRDKLAMLGSAVLLLLVSMALCAPLLSRHVTHFTPEDIELGATLKRPGYRAGPGEPVHWLGTDDLGRDVLTRAIYGGRVSLYVSFLTVLISLTVGTVIGAVAGYYGGVVDTLLMRIVDIVLSVPSLFLLILISVVFHPGVTGLAIVIASLNWTTASRLVRGEFLALKARDFVDAARTVGAKDWQIIFKHVLPNATSPIIVSASLAVVGVILTEAALSFLGMGVTPPTPSWGNMLTKAQEYLYSAPHLIVIPGFFIFITVLSGNFVGNGLRDALDPKMNR